MLRVINGVRLRLGPLTRQGLRRRYSSRHEMTLKIRIIFRGESIEEEEEEEEKKLSLPEANLWIAVLSQTFLDLASYGTSSNFLKEPRTHGSPPIAARPETSCGFAIRLI
jgi:hypothetical protein